MGERGGGSGPHRLVYAETDQTLRTRVATELEDGDAFVVEPVAAVDGVLDALEDDEPVDCVLAGVTLADGDWLDLVDAVRDRDPDLPVVLYPPGVDPDVASRAASAGVTEYLPRPWDEDGELEERLRSAADEFDRIRRLRSTRERLDGLLETFPFSVYIKDREARYVDASKPFRAALDEVLDDDDDLAGKTDVDLWGDLNGEVGVESYRDDRQVIETGEPVLRKEERHDTGDRDAWMETSKYPWRVDGDIRGLIGLTRNVTGEKERTQELRRKSQRLEQFASFVSHDLRNPINIAQGYLDRAIETGDQAALEEVDDALSRMDTLVEDLLYTVRRGDESSEWIDFCAFVERVWTATETEDATLVVDVPEDATIAAVGGQLRQALDNLFRNADQHGGPDVTVRVGLTDVGFFVEDDGPGIDPDDRDDVFEYGHSEDGTGIGLSIVDEIASSHGWEVGLTESDEGGARFEFEECLVRRKEFATVEEGEEVPLLADANVGGATPAGSFEHDPDAGVWTVTAGGEDLWNDVEEHYFVHGPVAENARIVARVTSLEDVHEFSKAGVMVRDWTDTGSPLAYVGATPEHGPEVIARAFPGDPIETKQYTDLDSPARWYRLDWIDNTATLQTSTDGTEWTTLDRRAIAGRDTVSIGLLGCSHDETRTCEAVFEDVRAVALEPGSGED